tara:strand:+ start:30758 stop:31729 length:972 start_codon:yes stop_codon:yes gene_type:complete
MRILFISSGNKKNGISPIIKAQGNSLEKQNIMLSYFPIIGKGIKGYSKNLFPLRKEIINGKYDIIHSHYGDSILLSAIANFNKVRFFVSFMGSDIFFIENKSIINFRKYIFKKIMSIIFRFIARYIADEVIVKSEKMKKELWSHSNPIILANGVDLNIFKPINNSFLKRKNKFLRIIFVSDINRLEKNYNLLEESVRLLQDDYSIEIINPKNLSPEQLNEEYNRAHLLALTSYYEGSPNVIKEAMACNLPIVSTNVGDVKQIFGKTAGCFIANSECIDFSKKIISAIHFNDRTNGRKRIIDLGLDSDTISTKLIELYNQSEKN